MSRKLRQQQRLQQQQRQQPEQPSPNKKKSKKKKIVRFIIAIYCYAALLYILLENGTINDAEAELIAIGAFIGLVIGVAFAPK